MAAFVPTQLPLGIAEGFVTAAAYRFILLRRPELLLDCSGIRESSVLAARIGENA
jgi:hypothetical protein